VHNVGVETLQVRDVAETKSVVRVMSMFGAALPKPGPLAGADEPRAH